MPTELEPIEPTPKKEVAKNFWVGFGISLGVNIVVVACFSGTLFFVKDGSLAPVSTILAIVGLLLQPGYFITGVIFALRKYKTGMASGLITGSALSVLAVPATCFGLMFSASH
ncbi:MAG: hypothetical protein K2W95_00080 [Candidatus Obscuribacterales bacterium]|nr:hypothetical protein [Candidatus Obscuribacterales bacterium]